MSEKENPVVHGRAPTGQTFITEAKRGYGRFDIASDPRTLKFDVISSFSGFSSLAGGAAQSAAGAESGPAHG